MITHTIESYRIPSQNENIGQGQKSLRDTPSDAKDDLCQIWKECKQNCRFFQGESRKIRKICKNIKFQYLLQT